MDKRMVEKTRDVQRRLAVLMDLWNKILDKWENGEKIDRKYVVEALKNAYGEEKLTPLRGASEPEDIYDKEMVSLYVVGKYGMGLEELYPQLFDEVFPNEIRYDKVINLLLSEEAAARDKILALVGGRLDDNTVARIFRLKFTEVYFGFSEEESLARLLKAFAKAFPEESRIAVKYARFYIAFKVAMMIYRGEVRDRITKEALKQATALSFSDLQGSIPDDSYIERIAVEVFGVRRNFLKGILGGGRGKKGSGE